MIQEQELQKRSQQPAWSNDCGLFAIRNLYLRLGYNPPAIETLLHLRGPLARSGTDSAHLYGILNALELPGLLSHHVLGRGTDVKVLFTALLDLGCEILFKFSVESGNEVSTHWVVAESCNDEGVAVVCSDPNSPGRYRVPWEVQCFDVWNRTQPGRWDGINRDFITIYPNT